MTEKEAPRVVYCVINPSGDVWDTHSNLGDAESDVAKELRENGLPGYYVIAYERIERPIDKALRGMKVEETK